MGAGGACVLAVLCYTSCAVLPLLCYADGGTNHIVDVDLYEPFSANLGGWEPEVRVC